MISRLSKEQMEKLTTKRLLAYKNKLMKVPEEASWGDPNGQLNKSDPEWQRIYTELKEVLATREHVE